MEVNTQQFFQGLAPDDDFMGLDTLRTAGLPMEAANCLVPIDLTLVGPAVDWARLEQYMERVRARAGGCGGGVLVLEPLCRRECNIINTVAEAMSYVQSVNDAHFPRLLNTYHFWMAEESVDHVRAAVPWIKHVHVADLQGRVARSS